MDHIVSFYLISSYIIEVAYEQIGQCIEAY